MKFNCGRTWEEKRKAKEKWHKWFAWYPVNFGSNNCRWLETIERKGEYRLMTLVECGWVYEYRLGE